MSAQRARAPGWIVQPFHAFFRLEAAGGILLILATVAALAWANSAAAPGYRALWEMELSFTLDGRGLSKDLAHWINDGLMAVFFFLVGLEIKRELLGGELAEPRQAALPAMAALGGVVVPALLFLAITGGGEGARGWGIPVATDIAFALGALATLGRRAPLGLKVFLTALAIVDDLVAVLIIALFYTAEVAGPALGVAAFLLLAMVGAGRAGLRAGWIYLVLAFGVWLAVLQSGVHATVAGVLAALAVPHARPRGPEAPGAEEQGAPQPSLLERLEHGLQPWVAFVILPLFALANAGIALDAEGLGRIVHPVSVGVIVGLVVGKQVGVTVFAWLAVRTGIAVLPAGVTWGHIYGVSWLCGIGFTMSLFIANLAFPAGEALDAAKIGILAGSTLAGLAGWAILWRISRGGDGEERGAP